MKTLSVNHGHISHEIYIPCIGQDGTIEKIIEHSTNNILKLGNVPFVVGDIFGEMSKLGKIYPIIFISDVYVDKDYRGHTIGSHLLDMVTFSMNNGYVIVTCAYQRLEDGEEAPDHNIPNDEEYAELVDVLERLDKFFTKNNFVDCNFRYGTYAFKRAYMYNSDLVKDIGLLNDND